MHYFSSDAASNLPRRVIKCGVMVQTRFQKGDIVYNLNINNTVTCKSFSTYIQLSPAQRHDI